MEGILLLGAIVFVIYMCTREAPPQTDIKQNMERNMICPHCQTRGSVTTKKVKQKQGIHGGKATAAVLTCGLTLFGTGLSRKQKITEATCAQCGASWSY